MRHRVVADCVPRRCNRPHNLRPLPHEAADHKERRMHMVLRKQLQQQPRLRIIRTVVICQRELVRIAARHHRPPEDLDQLAAVDAKLKLGLGVIDVKVNRVETPEEVAQSIDRIVKKLGPGRLAWVHPDCGFWMLKRSVADRKMESLVKGRDLYLGRA